ncbi:hypothetical protein [Caloranaerobacter azorensis]|uniref:DUF2268 domain-containing protein n=1 Tax=Caloranaerobacter azorensis TaxID=116090 RepID=A0A6P1YC19_9FIRM|nr:hypothetical protein [Caloranaerobacter azorensis]QIB26721.1 hypothetical protein G3A45_05045 [Caloranaerobacter azorensis]
MIRIIDTFKEFNKVFRNNLNLSIEEKIDLWDKEYICKFPELEKKIKEDYALNGYDWREIARTRVFNNTNKDYKKMIQAYNNILQIIDGINKKVFDIFNLDLELNIVLYHGLCNSAGWVDRYNGKRAILYGIDKIAELKWHTVEKLEPLIAHELCHVIHFELRGEDDLPKEVEKSKYNIGIWRIYEEGFAQFYQNKLLGKDVDSRGKEWIERCNDKKNDLKRLYEQALREDGAKRFFGDWFEVLGINDAGYFLGAELIKRLEQKYSINKLAQLSFDMIEKEVLDYLSS